jgi:hypothetical protein
VSVDRELHDAGRCAELVPVPTEDGIVDGRCGRPISTRRFTYRTYSDPTPRTTTLPMCDGHAEDFVGWNALTGAEQLATERQEEGR